jgi:hypothetical protein
MCSYPGEIPTWVYESAVKEGEVWRFSGSVHDVSLLNVAVPLAREEALHDVASQILRTIGASYSVSFSSHTTRTTERVRQTIDERFHYSASGFMSEIETRIVSQSFERGSGGVVYRMLAYFPKSLEF